MKIFNRFLYSILFIAGAITGILWVISHAISEVFRICNEQIYRAVMSLD